MLDFMHAYMVYACIVSAHTDGYRTDRWRLRWIPGRLVLDE